MSFCASCISLSRFESVDSIGTWYLGGACLDNNSLKILRSNKSISRIMENCLRTSLRLSSLSCNIRQKNFIKDFYLSRTLFHIYNRCLQNIITCTGRNKMPPSSNSYDTQLTSLSAESIVLENKFDRSSSEFTSNFSNCVSTDSVKILFWRSHSTKIILFFVLFALSIR